MFVSLSWHPNVLDTAGFVVEKDYREVRVFVFTSYACGWKKVQRIEELYVFSAQWQKECTGMYCIVYNILQAIIPTQNKPCVCATRYRVQDYRVCSMTT